MHVLIIPSEEFVPSFNPMVGIFQYHQAKILVQGGYKVGVLSITQSFSLPMIFKATFKKALHQKAGNACDAYSLIGLIKLGYQKIAFPQKFIVTDTSLGMPVVRINGFYYTPPADNYNEFGWIKAGIAAFEHYTTVYGMPDVIHAHNAIYAGMLAQKLQSKYKVPFLLTEHSTAFARRLIKDKKLLQKIKEVYNKANVVTAVSEPFCRLLNETFKINKFICFPNVLDQELEMRPLPVSNTKNDIFTFINIAELHPKKDHLLLIKAFKNVYVKNNKVQLWIGGEGELSQELRSYVKQENLEACVHFLGALNRHQVFDYLTKADCFVLSSKYETFGVVVIEAMLCGKPVIVTKCGGPESFVERTSGIIIEKENENELTNAMLDIITGSTTYNPVEIREYAISNFGKDKFLQLIRSLYKRAVATTHGKMKQEKAVVLFS